jgi:hypothetical protein
MGITDLLCRRKGGVEVVVACRMGEWTGHAWAWNGLLGGHVLRGRLRGVELGLGKMERRLKLCSRSFNGFTV